MSRDKDTNWDLPENCTYDKVQTAVLMDLRDEMKENNRLLLELAQKVRCFRIPLALDAMISVGREAKRRERNRRKKAHDTRRKNKGAG